MVMSTLKIIFMGTPEFAIPSLDVLINNNSNICAVYCQPPRPAGRGKTLRKSPRSAPLPGSRPPRGRGLAPGYRSIRTASKMGSKFPKFQKIKNF